MLYLHNDSNLIAFNNLNNNTMENFKTKFVSVMDRINDRDRWMVPVGILCLAYFAAITVVSLIN